MASARERGPGRWELRAYAGVDPLTGRKRWRSKTVAAASKVEARKLATAFQVEVDQAQPATGATGTLGQLWDAWVRHHAATWAPATTRMYRDMRTRRLGTLADTPVERITPAMIMALEQAMIDRGGPGGGRLDPVTVRRFHAALSSCLQTGVRWEWLARNPAAGVGPQVPARTEVAPPADADVIEALRLAEGDREWWTFLVLAVATGARRQELAALRWSDRADDGRLWIRRAVDQNTGAVKSTKTRQVRAVHLDAVAAAAWDAWRLDRRAHKLQAGARWDDDGWVFESPRAEGRPLMPQVWTARWGKHRALVPGLATTRLHDLRHWAATSLLTGGIDAASIAKRMGWAAGARTLYAVYGHVTLESDRAAADLLGRRRSG